MGVLIDYKHSLAPYLKAVLNIVETRVRDESLLGEFQLETFAADAGKDETQALKSVSTMEQRYSTDPSGSLGNSSVVGWVGPVTDSLCKVTNNFLFGFSRPQVAYGCMEDSLSDKKKYPLFGTSGIKYAQLSVALGLSCNKWGWRKVVLMFSQSYVDLSIRFLVYFGSDRFTAENAIDLNSISLGEEGSDRLSNALSDADFNKMVKVFTLEFGNVRRQGLRIVCVLASFLLPMVKGMHAAEAFGRNWVVISGISEVDAMKDGRLLPNERDALVGLLAVSPATPAATSFFPKLLLQTIAAVGRAEQTPSASCTSKNTALLARRLDAAIKEVGGSYPVPKDLQMTLLALLPNVTSQCSACLVGAVEEKEILAQLVVLLRCMGFPYSSEAIFIPWLHDALMTMVYALNLTSARGEDVKDGLSIMRSIYSNSARRLKFIGAQGEVTFDSHYDNQANWAGRIIEAAERDQNGTVVERLRLPDNVGR